MPYDWCNLQIQISQGGIYIRRDKWEQKDRDPLLLPLSSLRAFCLPWLLDLAVNTLPFLRSKASGYSGTISLRARWRKTALISPPQCPWCCLTLSSMEWWHGTSKPSFQVPQASRLPWLTDIGRPFLSLDLSFLCVAIAEGWGGSPGNGLGFKPVKDK